MSYKIEVTDRHDNPLTKRVEVTFSIEHPKSGSPNRYEVKEKLAALESADESLVFIEKINTVFGARHVEGLAFIYQDKESADKFEPAWSQIRNMPKEDRKEARKNLKNKKRGRA